MAAHLAEIVDRLRAVDRWPAGLDPARASSPPRASRIAATFIAGAGWLIVLGGLLWAAAGWRRGRLSAPAPK